MGTDEKTDCVIRINRRDITPGEASVSIFDRGFLFGDSIYEVVRTVGGKLFAWDEHMQRLFRSAQRISLSLPWSADELQEEIEAAIGAKRWPGETYVRIIVTRGVGRIDLMPTSSESPNLIVIVKELPELSAALREGGLVLCVTDVRRNSRLATDPAIKSGNYLNNVLALMEAKRKGADDALMLNENGHLTECSTSNFFMVSDGVVRTPSLDSGILQGITRDFILKVAANEGIVTEERELTLVDLVSADEIFITGTIKAVAPVRKVIGPALWEARIGPPGPITDRIGKAYRKWAGF